MNQVSLLINRLVTGQRPVWRLSALPLCLLVNLFVAPQIAAPANLAPTEIVVVMDLHDTTFMPDYQLVADAWHQLPTKLKLKYFPKLLWQLTGYGYQKLIAKTLIGIEHQLIEPNFNPQYQQLITQTISGFKPLPGVEQLLTKLNQAGIKVFAFSNIGPLSYQQLSQQYPRISRQFTGRVILETALTPHKSQAAAYQRCIAEVTKALGYTPKKFVFFDDTHRSLFIQHRDLQNKILHLFSTRSKVCPHCSTN